jgi:flagellar biosynthesis chaperone FliJ
VNRVSQLRRLCELRRLEEQHHAAQLGEARKRLQQIDEALDGSRVRRDAGRDLIEESIRTGDLESRIAGVEEIASAKRKANVLATLKHNVEEHVRQTRGRFFSKRTERCQAETLLDAALREEARNAERRSQSALDEWHRTVHRRPRWDVAGDEQSTESTTS